MSSSKHIDKICIAILLAGILITILFMNGESLGLQVTESALAEETDESGLFTSNDLNDSWDTSSATYIQLNGSSARISGSGAYVWDGDVYIRNGGYYVLSGTLDNGSVVVNSYRYSKVWLCLNGVEITNSSDSALIVEQADKVFVTLAEGSSNSLSDGVSYDDDAAESGHNAALFSRDDLTINGSGSLQINGQYKHGIVSKDGLRLCGGELSIDSIADAIHVNDETAICDTSLTINTWDDAIHSDRAVYITSGNIRIEKCYEGIEAQVIVISGGESYILAEDDGLNANGSTDSMSGMGNIGGSMPGGDSMSANMAGGPGGGSMSGNMAGGPGGGSMSGNMAGGPGGDNMNGNFAAAMPDDASSGTETDSESDSSAAADTYILISGGKLTIINESASDADGLDSNGDLYITGGEVFVSLANNGTNSALDYASESGGVAEISGGTIIAAGSYSMAEQFNSSSSQCSILYTISGGAEAGSRVAIEDAGENVLLEWEVPCSFSAVNISCPQMQVGETYLVVINDSVEAITLEESSASFGDASSSGFGGAMHMGSGMSNRDDIDFSSMRPGGDSMSGNMADGPGGGSMSGNMAGGPGGSMSGNMAGGIPGMDNMQDGNTNSDSGQESTASGIALSEVSKEAWFMLGASFALAFAALAVSILFKRRRSI